MRTRQLSELRWYIYSGISNQIKELAFPAWLPRPRHQRHADRERFSLKLTAFKHRESQLAINTQTLKPRKAK